MTATKRYSSPKASICILLAMVVLIAASIQVLQQHIRIMPLLAGESKRDHSTLAFAAHPKHSSSYVAISPDGATLLVVNPDSNSLTLVDTISRSAVTELVVGIDPRSVAVSPDGTTAYVANQGSDSVSVIRLAARTDQAFEPGALFSPMRVTGDYRGHPLTLDTFKRSSGKSSTTYTRIRLGVNNPFALCRAHAHLRGPASACGDRCQRRYHHRRGDWIGCSGVDRSQIVAAQAIKSCLNVSDSMDQPGLN